MPYSLHLSDFMKPLVNYYSSTPLSDAMTLRTSRVLATIFGLLTIAFAFLVDNLGTSVVILALTVFGVCGGPLLGLFVQVGEGMAAEKDEMAG